jgi:hypothetical protein
MSDTKDADIVVKRDWASSRVKVVPVDAADLQEWFEELSIVGEAGVVDAVGWLCVARCCFWP